MTRLRDLPIQAEGVDERRKQVSWLGGYLFDDLVDLAIDHLINEVLIDSRCHPLLELHIGRTVEKFEDGSVRDVFGQLLSLRDDCVHNICAQIARMDLLRMNAVGKQL